jgi:hypothetical protein
MGKCDENRCDQFAHSAVAGGNARPALCRIAKTVHRRKRQTAFGFRKPDAANAENIDVDTLNKNQRRGGDEAPPRYRISPRRWGYPLFLYASWKIRQIRKAEAGPVSPPRKRKPKDSESATAIEAA